MAYNGLKYRQVHHSFWYRLQDGIIFYKMATYRYITNHIMRYTNNWTLLAKLSPCARALIDFLTEEMDSNNLVDNNRRVKEKFCALLQSKAEIHYSLNTVDKAYIELLDNKILIKEDNNSRGTYMVNPEYFSRVAENKRSALMAKMKGIDAEREKERLLLIKSQIENK